MYFRDNPDLFSQYHISSNEDYGFIWMDRAIGFMENFYINRDLYPYINDFMPELADFLNNIASNIGTVIEEYNFQKPYITNIFPLPNSVVDAGIKEIRIEFSQPMIDAMFR
ncbi:MAG: DUF4932 domain-containing protein [Dysgonomonas sp.]